MTSLTKNVLNSSFWMLLISVIQRGLGLISTLILARLLTPEDFGIVAIATLILYFFEKFTNTGTNVYILQKSEVTDDDLNTAWTMDVGLKIIVWLLLTLGAPWIADFYQNPNLIEVVRVFAVILLIRGFTNPGLLLLRKHFQYQKIFVVSVLQKLFSFIVVMIVAYLYRSYWAMVAGEVVFFSVLLVASYMIHSHKPRFTLSQFKVQWDFSKWVLCKGFIGFVKGQLDTLLVSKLFVAAELGKYHVNRHIAIMPAQDVIIPALEPIISALSKSKDDDHGFSYQFNLCFFTLALAVFPISAFMWFFSQPIVAVLLGHQWADTYPIMAALGVLVSAFALGQLVNKCFLALGQTKPLFWFDVISLVMLAFVLLSLNQPTLEWFALVRGLLEVLLVVVLVVWLAFLKPLNLSRLSLLVLPVLSLSIVSAWLVSLMNTWNFEWPLIKLIVDASCFFMTYFAFVGLFFMIYARRTSEGQHITGMILTLVDKLKNRIN